MSKKSLPRGWIVLTRSAEGNKEWSAFFQARGFRVYEFPTIETVPVKPNARLKNALARLHEFDWIIFTSAAGPHYMKALAKRMRVRLPARNMMPRVAAVGKRTGDAVKSIGYKAVFLPSRSDGKTLGRELKITRGSSILLLRAHIASSDLPLILKKRGARVTDIPIYKTNIIRKAGEPRFKKLLMSGEVECIVFASPSAVRGFVARTKGGVLDIAQHIPVIALGPASRFALWKANFKRIKTAHDARAQGILDCID